MVPSLFLPQNLHKKLFSAFLVLLFPLVTLFSQTVIKERVIINPSAKHLQLQKSTTVYNPIIFGFGGARPFSFSVSGPAGSTGGSNGGFGAPASEVSLPAVNGEYHVVVTTNYPDSYSDVGYYAIWQDPSGTTQWIAGYDMWFYPDRGTTVKEDRFTFNGVPPPPPVQDNVKISMTGESEIWPYLPSTLRSASRGSDRPGYNPYTSFTILLKNNGLPIPNTKVKVTIIRIEGTGGHDHTNSLNAQLCGKLNNYDNPHVFTTDGNGEILIQQLRSSEVSGYYKIVAALDSNTNVKDSTTITVRVPDLFDFRTILNDGWELTGDHAYNDSHRYNHFCNRDMGIALADIIIDYNEWDNEYSRLLNRQSQKVHINDMSLIFGGDFDYPAGWDLEKKHQFHRVGFSVDVDQTLDKSHLRKLTDLVKSNKIKKGIRDKERPMIHYEFKGGYYK